jgi:hypothetical protein
MQFGDEVEVILGTCRFFLTLKLGFCVPIILRNYMPILLEVEDGRPLISIVVFGRDMRIAVAMVRNELLFRSDLFDVVWRGSTFRVYFQDRSLLLEICFRNGRISVNHLLLHYGGMHVIVTQGCLYTLHNDMSFENMSFENLCAGIVLEATHEEVALREAPLKGALHFANIPMSAKDIMRKKHLINRPLVRRYFAFMGYDLST